MNLFTIRFPIGVACLWRFLGQSTQNCLQKNCSTAATGPIIAVIWVPHPLWRMPISNRNQHHQLSNDENPAHFCEINQSGTVIGLSARGGCLVYLCCYQTHKKGETVYTVPTVTCLENPEFFLLMCKQIFAKTRLYNLL